MEKVVTWIKIILTILAIAATGIFIVVFRVPLTGFIKSLQGNLKGEGKKHSATQIAEEDKSTPPTSGINEKELYQKSKDRTEKTVAYLDSLLESLSNVKTSK